MKKSIFFLAFIILLTEYTFAHSGDSINIPSGTTPTIDGIKSAGEWDDAYQIQFLVQGMLSIIFIKHSSTNLYIAFDSPFSASCGIYLDKNHNGGNTPQIDDIWIHGSAGPFEFKGDNSIWQQQSLPSDWNYMLNIANGISEFQISLSKLGIIEGDNTLGVLFSLFDWSVSHTNEITWPSGGYPNCINPDSWANMKIHLTTSTVSNLNIINKVKVYPNPVTDYLYIDAKKTDNIIFSIYNITGQSIKEGNLENNFSKINISNLKDGIYFIKFNVGDKTKVIKFIKKSSEN